MLRVVASLLVVLVLGACSATEDNPVKVPIIPVEGSVQWYHWVDNKVITGDQVGHGPDIGSLEWCQVIDVKLFNKASGQKPCSPKWNEQVTEALKKH